MLPERNPADNISHKDVDMGSIYPNPPVCEPHNLTIKSKPQRQGSGGYHKFYLVTQSMTSI